MPVIGETARKLNPVNDFIGDVNHVLDEGPMFSILHSPEHLEVVKDGLILSRTVQYRKSASQYTWQMATPWIEVDSLSFAVSILSSQAEKDERLRRRWRYKGDQVESAATRVLSEEEAALAERIAANPKSNAAKLGDLCVLTEMEILTGPPISSEVSRLMQEELAQWLEQLQLVKRS